MDPKPELTAQQQQWLQAVENRYRLSNGGGFYLVWTELENRISGEPPLEFRTLLPRLFTASSRTGRGFVSRTFRTSGWLGTAPRRATAFVRESSRGNRPTRFHAEFSVFSC